MIKFFISAVITFIIFLLLIIDADAQICNNSGKGNELPRDQRTLCAPSEVSWNISYFGLDTDRTNEAVIDWGDGSPPQRATLVCLNPTSTLSLRKYEATATHTYPKGKNGCNYKASVYLYVDNQRCEDSRQDQDVIVWDTDDILEDGLATDVAEYRVCAGNAVTVDFTDITEFNCMDPDHAYNRGRWIQWEYGTANTITGDVKVGGEVQSFPYKEDPVRLGKRALVSNVTTQGIYIPNTTLAGEFFELTLHNWNSCNPYEIDGIPTGNAPVSTQVYVRIVDAPHADFEVSDNSVCVENSINLINNSTPELQYSWDFGDGTTSTEYTPSKTYSEVGNYTITLTVTDHTITGNTGTCDATISKDIEVLPQPVADFTIDPAAAQCGKTDVALTNTSAHVPAGTTWQWEIRKNKPTGQSVNTSGSNTGGFASTDQDIETKLPYFGTAPTAVYYVKLIANTPHQCSNTSGWQTITVKANVGTPAFSSQLLTRCQGAGTTQYTAQAKYAENGYDWAISPAAAGTITHAGLVTWNAGFSGIATVEITAKGCGPSKSKSVNVTVTPHVGDLAPISGDAALCQGMASTVYTTSATNATGYAWTVTGAGNTISEGASSATVEWGPDFSGTATITVTASGCNGTSAPVSKNVLVKPTPQLSNPASDYALMICSEGEVTFFPVAVSPGSSFKWTTTIEGSVSGVTEVGNDQSIGTDGISDVLVNSSTEAGKVTYHITPYKDGCEGTTKDFTVVISQGKPDDAGAITGPDELCENETEVVFEVPAIRNAEEYVWTLPAGAAITDGANTNSITVDFNNTDTDEYAISVFGKNSCGVGQAATYDIEIRPGPVLRARPERSTICHGEETEITLESDFPDTRYSWEVISKGDDISGASNASNQNSTAIRQQLFNDGSSPQSITYRIAPTGDGCEGDYQDVTITVNPSPEVNVDATATTLCSGSSTDVTLSSAVEGITFSWTAAVSDPLLTGAADGDGNEIMQTLVNESTVAQTVKYTITPAANECAGVTEEVTITVNPASVVTLEIINPIICNEAKAEINFDSSVSSSITSYSWTVLISNPDVVSGAFPGSGNSISQTLTNTGTTPEQITYQVTPVDNGCPGETEEAVVTVNPSVTKADAGEDDATCGFVYALAANTPEVGTGKWHMVSGAGTASFADDADPNTTVTVSDVGNYTFGWTITNGGCDTDIDYVSVTFKDAPVTSAIIGKPKVCVNAENVLYEVDFHADNTYAWSLEPALNAPSVKFGGGPADPLISLDFGSNEWSGELFVREVNISCTGEVQKIAISAHKNPVAHAGDDQTICTGSPITLGAAQAATEGSGSYVYVWSPATGLNDPALANPTARPDASKTYTLTVTDAHTGCASAQDEVNITVEPVAHVSLSSSASDNTICTGEEVTFTAAGADAYTFYLNGISVQGPSASDTYTTSSLSNKDTVYVSGKSNGSCLSESNRIVTMVNDLPTATLSGATDICAGSETSLTLNMTGKMPFEVIYTDGADIFTLHDLAFEKIITVKPTAATTYALVSVKDAYGCLQSITDQQAVVNVANAVAKFSIDSEDINCSSHTITFVNEDVQPGITYTWNWGDGTPGAITTSADTAEIEHTFLNHNSSSHLNYHVTLVATHDALGCSRAQTQTVEVNPTLELKVEQDKKSGCPPLSVNFVNNSQGVKYHKWYYRIKGANKKVAVEESKSATFLLQNKTSETIVYEVVYEASADHCSAATQIYEVRVYPELNPSFTVTPAKQKLPASTVYIKTEVKEEFGEYLWDFGDGTSSTSKDPGSHTYDTYGEFFITLKISNKGCVQHQQEKVEIEKDPNLPAVAFSVDRKEGCGPLTVAFNNQSRYVEPSSFRWDFGDGKGTSSAEHPLHTYDRPGKYTVKLEAIDIFGQYVYLVKEFLIEVYDQPKALFSVGPTTVYLPDRPVTTQNLSMGATSYLWDFGDGETSTEFEPIHYYTREGVYDVMLVAVNEKGCSDTLLIKSVISAENPKIANTRIPNAFTPDPSGPSGGYFQMGDISNDIFIPVTEGVTELSMTIYNRWGKLLFMSHDKNIGWDGYYQGKLCAADVYTYMIEMKYANGESVSKIGNVTLIQ